MQVHVTCIVCGNSGSTQLYESTFEGTLEEAADHFLAHRKKVAHGRIVRCIECGFVYTSPQFSAAEYGRIYQKAPREPDNTSGMDAAGKARFTLLAKIVREHVAPGPFMDFGCGSGAFLDVMNDGRGFGFETGEAGKRESRDGHPIVTGNLFEMEGRSPFDGESYSYITSFDVFEHLPDLPRYVQALRRLIKADGHVIVSVPNVESLVAKLTGERWNMILLEHLWYFSPQTIVRMMQKLGFEHVWTSNMPYAAPLSHLSQRVAQTYELPQFVLPKWIGSIVLPIPIGLMVCVFRRA